jgi:hypothetical protein
MTRDQKIEFIYRVLKEVGYDEYIDDLFIDLRRGYKRYLELTNNGSKSAILDLKYSEDEFSGHSNIDEKMRELDQIIKEAITRQN